ncbi:hypothetical protein Ciccas_003691 [Cichlidogyrus casuarinus]|uniref:Uncharacterized protein n=1 Tax=Cichlidogyrus casuarinus TaxID=1844966 RepID=A0ABD2QDP3_9PLAT
MDLQQKLEEQANYIKHLETYSDNLKTQFALAENTIDRLRAGLVPRASNVGSCASSLSASVYGTLGRNLKPNRSASIGLLCRTPSLRQHAVLDPRDESKGAHSPPSSLLSLPKQNSLWERFSALGRQLHTIEEQRKADRGGSTISSSCKIDSTAQELRHVKHLQESLKTLQQETKDVLLDHEDPSALENLNSKIFNMGLRMEELQLVLTQELEKQTRKKPFSDNQPVKVPTRTGVDSLLSTSTSNTDSSRKSNNLTEEQMSAFEVQFTQFLKRYTKLVELNMMDENSEHLELLKSNLRRVAEVVSKSESSSELVLSPQDLEALFAVDEETSRKMVKKISPNRRESSLSGETVQNGSGVDSGLSLGTPPKRFLAPAPPKHSMNGARPGRSQLVDELDGSDSVQHYPIKPHKSSDIEHSFLLRQRAEDEDKESLQQASTSESMNYIDEASSDEALMPKQEVFPMLPIRYQSKPKIYRSSFQTTRNFPIPNTAYSVRSSYDLGQQTRAYTRIP